MPPPSYRDYRLPPGRHGLGAEEVAANQRWRLIGAASEVLAEKRLIGLTGHTICRRAGLSNQSLYEHFENVDDLLISAFANAAQVLFDLIAGSCGGSADPHGQNQKALAAALSLGAEEPGLTALMRLEVAVAIPEIGAERERLVARLAALATAQDAVGTNDRVIAATLALAVDCLERRAPDVADSLPVELTALG